MADVEQVYASAQCMRRFCHHNNDAKQLNVLWIPIWNVISLLDQWTSQCVNLFLNSTCFKAAQHFYAHHARR